MAKKKPAAKKKAGSQTAAQKRAQELRSAARKKAKSKLAPPEESPSPTELAKPAKTSRVNQRRAKTAAKQNRIKKSGLDTRVRGHVSARGRRAQGRRDSKG